MTFINEKECSKYTEQITSILPFSRKSTWSIWKYVNYHCIIDFFVWIIDNSKWNYYCCNAQILNLKWWIWCFFSESKQLPWRRKWLFHAKLCSGEPLQAGDGTKKFLFHSMIVMICCKRTSCVLIFMFHVKEFLTMQNVFKVNDYQTCLSIKPRIILQVCFYFSSWTIIQLPFNSDFFRTYFSDW